LQQQGHNNKRCRHNNNKINTAGDNKIYAADNETAAMTKTPPQNHNKVPVAATTNTPPR